MINKSNFNREETLYYYNKDLTKCASLSKEENRKIDEIIKKLKMTDSKEAMNELNNKLISSCLRLAYREATRYVNKDNELEDLIEAANEGLVMACYHYKPEYDVKFSSYASYWIHQYILAELKASDTIKLPSREASLLAKLKDLQNYKLSDKEIAASLNISEKKLKQLRRIPRCKTSLDLKLPNDTGGNESNLIDTISSNDINPLDNYVEHKYATDISKAVLKKLKGRDRKLISMRYGLNRSKAMSLNETAEVLGISRERVRQEQDVILKRLKSAPEIRRLADL